jgi:hypothetical protein
VAVSTYLPSAYSARCQLFCSHFFFVIRSILCNGVFMALYAITFLTFEPIQVQFCCLRCVPFFRSSRVVKRWSCPLHGWRAPSQELFNRDMAAAAAEGAAIGGDCELQSSLLGSIDCPHLALTPLPSLCVVWPLLCRRDGARRESE